MKRPCDQDEERRHGADHDRDDSAAIDTRSTRRFDGDRNGHGFEDEARSSVAIATSQGKTGTTRTDEK